MRKLTDEEADALLRFSEEVFGKRRNCPYTFDACSLRARRKENGLREGNDMFGYAGGYSDTDNIHYCPTCGEEVYIFRADGTATCDVCGERFAVITYTEED